MSAPYHSSAFQVVELVEEASLGAGGSPLHRLNAVRMGYWSPDGTSAPILPSGYIIPTGTIHGKEWSTAPAQGMMTFADLIPHLDSALIKAVASGAGPYTRLWTPLPAVDNLRASYSLVSGDTTAAYGYVGCYVDDLTLTFNRDQNDIAATWMGMLEVPGATLGSHALLESPVIPVEPQQTQILVSSGFAGSYAALGGQFSLTLHFSKLRNQVWTLDTSQASYADTVTPVPQVTAQLSYAADVSAGDYFGAFTLAKWRASQTVYLRLLNTYASGHSLQIDMALQLVKPAKKDDAGIFSLDSQATFVVGNTNKWIEITNVSNVPTLL